MKRTDRNLGLLAAVAVVLVAAVLWAGRREYVRDPPTLTGLAPSAITRVELDIPSLPPVVFQRRAHGWWRTAPDSIKAKDKRVERLAHLAATPVQRWLPAAQMTLANVGLEHPSATLVLDGVKLEYGGLTAIGSLRYVRAGSRIALVPRQYSPEVVVSQHAAQ